MVPRQLSARPQEYRMHQFSSVAQSCPTLWDPMYTRTSIQGEIRIRHSVIWEKPKLLSCVLVGSEELWPFMSQCREEFNESKVIRSDLLGQDSYEAYKWAGQRMLYPENLLGYSFIIKGKMGRGRRTSSSFLSRHHASIISSSSRLSQGIFLFLGKLGPQITVFYVYREHVLGITNLLSTLGRMWGSCHLCQLSGGMSHASVAWFCC